MACKLLLIVSVVSLADCSKNNLPKFDPDEKTIDCTDGKRVTQTCNIKFVVEPLTSMTYYKISSDFRELHGYRATFNSTGHIVPLPQGLDFTNL